MASLDEETRMARPMTQPPQDPLELPPYPGQPPGPAAPANELLQYLASSSRRLEIWMRILYEDGAGPNTAQAEARPKTPTVVIGDVRIKFWSMVSLLVTIAIAAIPAMIIIGIMVFVTFLVFGGFILSLGR